MAATAINLAAVAGNLASSSAGTANWLLNQQINQQTAQTSQTTNTTMNQLSSMAEFEDVFLAINEAIKQSKNHRLIAMLQNALTRLRSIASSYDGHLMKIKSLEDQVEVLQSQLSSTAASNPYYHYQHYVTPGNLDHNQMHYHQATNSCLQSAYGNQALNIDASSQNTTFSDSQTGVDVARARQDAVTRMLNQQQHQQQQQSEPKTNKPLNRIDRSQLAAQRQRVHPQGKVPNEYAQRTPEKTRKARRQVEEIDKEALYLESLGAQFASLRARYGQELLLQMMLDLMKGSFASFYKRGMAEQKPDPQRPGRSVYSCLDRRCGGKQFGNNITLQRHLLKEHMNDWKPFKCHEEGCTYRGYFRQELIRHLGTHDRSILRYHCQENECTFSTDSLKAFTTHMDVHNNVYRYHCSYEGCGKKFRVWKSLQDHEMTHKGIHKYACNICEKTFANSSTYKSHMKRHEKNEKCPVQGCSFATHRAKRLVCHLINEHKGHAAASSESIARYMKSHPKRKQITPPLICQTCSKAFIGMDRLRRHELSHTEERNFLCPICSRGFKTPKEVKKHQETHKAKEERKQYKCDKCDRTFFSRRHLQRHMTESRVHGGGGRQNKDGQDAKRRRHDDDSDSEPEYSDSGSESGSESEESGSGSGGGSEEEGSGSGSDEVSDESVDEDEEDSESEARKMLIRNRLKKEADDRQRQSVAQAVPPPAFPHHQQQQQPQQPPPQQQMHHMHQGGQMLQDMQYQQGSL